MSYLTAMEEAAAPILEFHNFNEDDEGRDSTNEMVGDFQAIHENVLNRKARQALFAQILASEDKISAIKEFIIDMRASARANPYNPTDLSIVMPENEIQIILDQFAGNDDDAIKHWYYKLFPRFTPIEIEVRHTTAMRSISQRKIDQLYYKKQLIEHGQDWVEFYNFDPKYEFEMARDLHIHENAIGRRITGQMCHKIVEDILQDPTPARLRKLSKEGGVQTIEADDLEDMFRLVVAKSPQLNRCTPSDAEKDAYIKEVFSEWRNDFTADFIKDRAQWYYDVSVP